MKQFIFVVVALVLGIPASMSGLQQTAAPDDGKREFVVSGCLLRNGYAGYAVEDSRVVAIDGKRLPEPAPGSAPVVPKKWILDGGGNLGPHTGEKVEVTGRTDWQAPSAQAATEEPPAPIPHLAVKSLKTVASSCA